MLQVQIIASGPYRENAGCENHPRWKCNGWHNVVMACNVPLLDAPAVMKEMEAHLNELSWSDEYSSCDLIQLWMAPNKMNSMDLIAFEYKHYEDIEKYSKEDLMAFLKAFGDEPEEKEAEPTRFELMEMF